MTTQYLTSFHPNSCQSIFEFFREWSYRVQPTQWDFSELPPRARDLIGEMHLVAHHDSAGFPFQVFLIEL